MNLKELFEAKVGARHVSAAMKNIVSYIEKKLDADLIKIPGIEHFHNSKEDGYGIRYVFNNSAKSIRFNWVNRPGDAKEITSINYWDGSSRDPNLTIKPKGVSLAQVLPSLVKVLQNPKVGKVTAFPASLKEESSIVSEAKRGDYSAEQALADFLRRLKSGSTLTRSDFIGSYHISNAGVFDTIVKDFAGKFEISGKRVGLPADADVVALAAEIKDAAGVIEVSAGGSNEKYDATEAEEEIADRIPFVETLDHLKGLVQGLVNGAFNALFVAGKGGSLSGSTPINIIVGNNIEKPNDNDKAKNSSKD